MKKLLVFSTLAGAAAVAIACSDSTTSPSSSLAISMASVYSATPAGFSQLYSSFSAAGDQGAFAPLFDHDGPGGRGGFGGPGHGMFGPDGHGPGFGLGLMGGGLDGPFLGDGLGGDHYRHDSANCQFAAGAGVTCTDTTHDGLITKRVSKFTDKSGNVQSAIDSTTNTIATTVSVSGTATRRDSSTSVVNEASTQTVTGLAKGSTQRTVNGASAGSENTTGKSPQGTFTAARSTGDTISGVVIPAASSSTSFPYPTAGTVIRAMTATVTITGQSPATTSRREVITYDGSAAAKVVITKDGTTQNCTLPLPHGHLTCS
jgi:hypothetical protein